MLNYDPYYEFDDGSYIFQTPGTGLVDKKDKSHVDFITKWINNDSKLVTIVGDDNAFISISLEKYAHRINNNFTIFNVVPIDENRSLCDFNVIRADMWNQNYLIYNIPDIMQGIITDFLFIDLNKTDYSPEAISKLILHLKKNTIVVLFICDKTLYYSYDDYMKVIKENNYCKIIQEKQIPDFPGTYVLLTSK